MASDFAMSAELEQITGEINDIFRALSCSGKLLTGQVDKIKLAVRKVFLRISWLSCLYAMIFSYPHAAGQESGGWFHDPEPLPRNGFQKLDKIKDPSRQMKQLEELTGKMRECKRLIKEFDRQIKDEESRNPQDINKQLNEKKQSMIKELNSYVALRKTYTSSLGNKRVELFDMGAEGSETAAEDNVQMASAMSNQELINAGMKTVDETDQAIERSKMVVEQTIEVGTQTATTLKGQTEQMGRIVNDLDTVHFSIKKATQLVKEIGRQVACDKFIMFFLFMIVCGVIAIIIVKIVHPNNKDIRDVPGLAPPAPTSRRLLSAQVSRGFHRCVPDRRVAVCIFHNLRRDKS